jgi:drug/metabolite transporter (DMT)-like permease
VRWNDFKADLWLLLCTFFWGATFSAVRDAMVHVSPFLWLGLRFTLGGLVLLPFCWRHLRGLGGDGWRDGLVLGAFMFAGFALQTAGLVYTTASRSAFITGMAVVLVPPAAVLALKSRLDLWQVLGVLLAGAGLYFLSRPSAGGFNRGDFYTALCAVCFAMVVVLVQKYTDRHHPLGLIMVQIVATVALSGLLLAAAEVPRFSWSPTLGPDIIATGLLATAGSLVIQFHWQRRTTPVRAAIIYTLEPVFAAGFAYVLLGETMGGWAWLGAGLILVGMLAAEVGWPGSLPFRLFPGWWHRNQ